MSFPVVLHPLGRLDLLDAAMRAAGERPESFEVLGDLARRVLLKRFPFAVYFRFDGKEVVVMAIVHVRRDPER